MRKEILKHLDHIDGIVFDYGGVIVYAPKGEWSVLPLCESVGLTREAALEGIWKYRNELDGGFISCREAYGRVLADNGLSADDDFYDAVLAADASGWTSFAPETLTLMKELKAMGKKLGILSNMYDDFYRDYFIPLAKEYRALCDVEIISSQYREMKPERPIYDRTAQAMGISPDRLLFLDDNESNVIAARSYGWRSEIYRA